MSSRRASRGDPGLTSDPDSASVTCDLAFEVTEPAEIALQVVAADSAGLVRSERFDVRSNGGPPASLEEIRNPQGERIHVILADPGRSRISLPRRHPGSSAGVRR